MPISVDQRQLGWATHRRRSSKVGTSVPTAGSECSGFCDPWTRVKIRHLGTYDPRIDFNSKVSCCISCLAMFVGCRHEKERDSQASWLVFIANPPMSSLQVLYPTVDTKIRPTNLRQFDPGFASTAWAVWYHCAIICITHIAKFAIHDAFFGLKSSTRCGHYPASSTGNKGNFDTGRELAALKIIWCAAEDLKLKAGLDNESCWDSHVQIRSKKIADI
jgi:hypothetical protein